MDLFLVIDEQLSKITHQFKDQIRKSICRVLGFKQSEVIYVATVKDKENPLYSKLTLTLPNIEEKIKELQFDALNKEPWLTELGVVELKVNKNSSIRIAEKMKGKHSENGQARQLFRVRSVLAMDPDLKIHCDLTFDTVLAIELSSAVNKKKHKSVLEQCESAMKIYHSDDKRSCDVRLAAIRFGNHNVVHPHHPDQQIAFVEKELSSDLKITSKIKPDAYCGGMLNSGIADALSKLVNSLKDKMRREATKLCIVVCFITSNSSTPEHYKCCFDHDVIDLGHTLATHAIPLYIIGIDTQASSTQAEENSLLSGLTAITGGRYFQIQDISLLKELIHCIIKENNSIEKNMGTVNDVVITEINKQYGDVNDVHLTECLHNSLDRRSSEIDCIMHNGAFLTPISQISERVSWADNLDDAIKGVKSLKKHMEAADKVPIPSRQVPTDGGKNLKEHMKVDDKVATVASMEVPMEKEKAAPKENVTVRQKPDKEVSTRMVRRQIERSAYYRPTICVEK